MNYSAMHTVLVHTTACKLAVVLFTEKSGNFMWNNSFANIEYMIFSRYMS